MTWRENWSEMIFGFFRPPPQKKEKFNLEGVHQNFVENEKSKLFKIARNSKKFSQKRVLDFLAPLKKFGGRTTKICRK